MAYAEVPTLVWLSYYQENTPGVDVLDNASTVLSPKGEPQPDAQLRILPECGGRTQTSRRFIRGVPELIVEVSHATRYTDLGPSSTTTNGQVCLSISSGGLSLMRCTGSCCGTAAWWISRRSLTGFLLGTFPGLWLDPQVP